MEDADVTVRGTGEMELKLIHIVVMVIALLHAVAIAVWAVLNLSGSKGELKIILTSSYIKRTLVSNRTCFTTILCPEERRSLHKPMGPAAAPGELSGSSPPAKLSGKAGPSETKKSQ